MEKALNLYSFLTLHDNEEEIVGTVAYIGSYDAVCDLWKEYLTEYEDCACVSQFSDFVNDKELGIEVQSIDINFYQP